MPNYKELYLKLFRAHSRVLAILAKATLETEENVMEASGANGFMEKEEEAQDKE